MFENFQILIILVRKSACSRELTGEEPSRESPQTLRPDAPQTADEAKPRIGHSRLEYFDLASPVSSKQPAVVK
jgi:hypothetical protein